MTVSEDAHKASKRKDKPWPRSKYVSFSLVALSRLWIVNAKILRFFDVRTLLASGRY